MARKRAITKCPPRTNEPHQSRKMTSRSRRKSEGSSDTDFISCVRTFLLLSLIGGICGFLFYPDIISALEKLQEGRSSTADGSSGIPGINTLGDFDGGQNDGESEHSFSNHETDLNEDELSNAQSNSVNRADMSSVKNVRSSQIHERPVKDSDVMENEQETYQNKQKVDPSIKRETKMKSSVSKNEHKNFQGDSPKSTERRPKTEQATANENEKIKRDKSVFRKKTDPGDSTNRVEANNIRAKRTLSAKEAEEELKGRDGKRKPLILRPGNTEFTIDLSKSFEQNVEAYEQHQSTEVDKKEGPAKGTHAASSEDIGKKAIKKKQDQGREEEGNNKELPQSIKGNNKPTKNAKKEKTDNIVQTKDNHSARKVDEENGAQLADKDTLSSLKTVNLQSNQAEKSIKVERHFDSDSRHLPPTQARNHNDKREPIILSAENSQITFDPSKHDIKTSNTSSDNLNIKKKNRTGKKTAENDRVNKFTTSYQKTFTPKKIFDGGRRIPPIELLPQKKTNSSVKVFLFDEFLSDRECDGLMKAHDKHVKAMGVAPLLCFDSVNTLKRHLKDVDKDMHVTPNVFTPGTKCLNVSLSSEVQTLMNSNWSYSTAFYPGESTFSNALATRIQRAMGLNPENGGKFQITSYPSGKAYKTHTDCTLNGGDKRDRVISVLMYLNTVDDGGETAFPDLGISVKPQKGRAIVWNNMNDKGVCEPHSQHVASVVKSGSKYILIRWYYYKNFLSLGKRQAPPALPRRGDSIPVVMCDEYSMGSCRWYDEWGYDILLEYERQRLNLV